MRERERERLKRKRPKSERKRERQKIKFNIKNRRIIDENSEIKMELLIIRLK